MSDGTPYEDVIGPALAEPSTLRAAVDSAYRLAEGAMNTAPGDPACGQRLAWALNSLTRARNLLRDGDVEDVGYEWSADLFACKVGKINASTPEAEQYARDVVRRGRGKGYSARVVRRRVTYGTWEEMPDEEGC